MGDELAVSLAALAGEAAYAAAAGKEAAKTMASRRADFTRAHLLFRRLKINKSISPKDEEKLHRIAPEKDRERETLTVAYHKVFLGLRVL